MARTPATMRPKVIEDENEVFVSSSQEERRPLSALSCDSGLASSRQRGLLPARRSCPRPVTARSKSCQGLTGGQRPPGHPGRPHTSLTSVTRPRTGTTSLSRPQTSITSITRLDNTLIRANTRSSGYQSACSAKGISHGWLPHVEDAVEKIGGKEGDNALPPGPSRLVPDRVLPSNAGEGPQVHARPDTSSGDSLENVDISNDCGNYKLGRTETEHNNHVTHNGGGAPAEIVNLGVENGVQKSDNVFDLVSEHSHRKSDKIIDLVLPSEDDVAEERDDVVEAIAGGADEEGRAVVSRPTTASNSSKTPAAGVKDTEEGKSKHPPSNVPLVKTKSRRRVKRGHRSSSSSVGDTAAGPAHYDRRPAGGVTGMSQFGLGKDGAICRTVMMFSSEPARMPYSACFHYPNNFLTHRYVLDQVKRQIHTVPNGYVTAVQFVDRNVLHGTRGLENRWLITLSSAEARDQLMRMGMKVFNRKIVLRRADDVISEEYREFLKYKRLLALLHGEKTDPAAPSQGPGPGSGQGQGRGAGGQGPGQPLVDAQLDNDCFSSDSDSD